MKAFSGIILAIFIIFAFSTSKAFADTIFIDDFSMDPSSNGWSETSSKFKVQVFESTATGQIVPATVQGTEARFEKTGSVAGIRLNIDRTIDTTGFSNISFDISGFQDSGGAYDALFGDTEPHNALRVEADYGSGFVLVFTDMQKWNGVEDTVGENAGSSIGGQLTNTATGLIPLSALADNNPNLKIRISWTTATLPNDFLLDNFELTGTSVPVTKTYVGPSNGVWELDNNWSPPGIPNQNDDIVITNTLVNIKSDVTIGPSGRITFDLDGNLRVNDPNALLTIQGSVVMNDGSDDLFAREGTILIDCTGSITLDQGQVIVQGTGTGGIFINHGIITGTLPGGDPPPPPKNANFFNIVIQSGGLFQNSGTLPSTILVLPSGTFETIPSICNTDGDGDDNGDDDVNGRGSGRAYQGPTIGMDNNNRLVVTCGVAFDGTCFDMTSLFHYEIKMYEMMSGTHTISITSHCARGVNTCNYVGIGIMPYSEDMNNPTWKIEVLKDHLGNLTPVIFDPEGFLGEVTVTTQIVDGKFLLVSFTVEFKNKDTGPMKFAVEVRDTNHGAQVTYLNEGVWIKDADAYPYIETAFEEPLEIEPLCIGEDANDRRTCAFKKVRDWATKNAEETLRQMQNNEYTYK